MEILNLILGFLINVIIGLSVAIVIFGGIAMVYVMGFLGINPKKFHEKEKEELEEWKEF